MTDLGIDWGFFKSNIEVADLIHQAWGRVEWYAHENNVVGSSGPQEVGNFFDQMNAFWFIRKKFSALWSLLLYSLSVI